MFEPLPINISTHEFVKSFTDWYGPVMGDMPASKAAVHIYINGEAHSNDSSYTNAWWAAERSLSDQAFGCSAHFASEQLAAHGFDVFQYYFTPGLAYHGSEVPYVFMLIDDKTPAEEKSRNTNGIILVSACCVWKSKR